MPTCESVPKAIAISLSLLYDEASFWSTLQDLAGVSALRVGVGVELILEEHESAQPRYRYVHKCIALFEILNSSSWSLRKFVFNSSIPTI